MSAEILSLLFFSGDFDFNNVDPEVIQEISQQTNMITSVILTVVIAVFLILVVYLVYFHITTKKPKRSTERYSNYKTTAAKITDVEMTSYFVKTYERSPEKPIENNDFYKKHINSNDVGRSRKINKENNQLEHLNQLRKSLDDKDRKDEVEKIRFKVRYEFSTDINNLYSGECFVYKKTDDIDVGKTIEIKYNPSNPMMNYSAYSAPIGTQ